MHVIEIDELVYQYIQSQAIPFEEKTPNDTLVRLFGLKRGADTTEQHKEKSLDEIVQGLLNAAPKKKKRKRSTDLAELVASGIVSKDEKLSFVDYTGAMIELNAATIMGKNLLYKGVVFSMSKLAEKLLKEHGYSSDSIRGPVHWVTSTGETIWVLWEKYLAAIDNEAAQGEI